jgi:hypothetical protein
VSILSTKVVDAPFHCELERSIEKSRLSVTKLTQKFCVHKDIQLDTPRAKAARILGSLTHLTIADALAVLKPNTRRTLPSIELNLGNPEGLSPQTFRYLLSSVLDLRFLFSQFWGKKTHPSGCNLWEAVPIF